jgi:hypothetical protein
MARRSRIAQDTAATKSSLHNTKLPLSSLKIQQAGNCETNSQPLFCVWGRLRSTQSLQEFIGIRDRRLASESGTDNGYGFSFLNCGQLRNSFRQGRWKILWNRFVGSQLQHSLGGRERRSRSVVEAIRQIVISDDYDLCVGMGQMHRRNPIGGGKKPVLASLSCEDFDCLFRLVVQLWIIGVGMEAKESDGRNWIPGRSG